MSPHRFKQRGSSKLLVADHKLINEDRYFDLNGNHVKTEWGGGYLPFLGHTYNSENEEINYFTSNVRSENPCDHYVKRVEHVSLVTATSEPYRLDWVVYRDVPGPNYYEVVGHIDRIYHEYLGAPAGNDVPGISQFSDDELYSLSLDSALEKHYDALRDVLGESMSLLNSLLEFRDFGKLFKTAKKLADGNNGALSESLLAHEYGIKPLARDLNSIMDMRSKREQMRDLVKRSAQNAITVRTKSTAGIAGRSGSVAPRPLKHSYSSHKYVYWDVSVGEAEIWFVSKVQPDLRALDNVLGDFALFSKAMGLTNPIAIAYDAIPFSFLLDNVVNIGRMTQKLDLLDFFTRSRIIHSTSHIKMSQVATAYVCGYPQSYETAIWNQPCAYSYAKRYTRWPGLPPEPSFHFEAPTDIGKLYADMRNAERLYDTYIRRPIDWIANKIF